MTKNCASGIFRNYLTQVYLIAKPWGDSISRNHLGGVGGTLQIRWQIFSGVGVGEVYTEPHTYKLAQGKTTKVSMEEYCWFSLVLNQGSLLSRPSPPYPVFGILGVFVLHTARIEQWEGLKMRHNTIIIHHSLHGLQIYCYLRCYLRCVCSFN